MYATDASVYKELPQAVVRPANAEDLRQLILFAREHHYSIIPRTAGTSLAGQVVGPGIVADVSRHMNRILEFNAEERWVRVEPGVVPDELNRYLRPHGLFFAPETSTSNRCMIGGMVGNNSCSAHSLIYGSTRDHVLEIEALLSDGSRAVFGEVSPAEFEKKCGGDSLESSLYRHIRALLSDPQCRTEIEQQYPDPSLHRRNTGYALDLLAPMQPFRPGGPAFNFCPLLCGSEGTLAITLSVKLNLLPLPPPVSGLLCVHFKTLEEALEANLIALNFQPGSIELMDQMILECTRNNRSQRDNRFFVEGEPGAILIIEWARNNEDEIHRIAKETEAALRAAGYGYHFPLVLGADQKKVWNLRKAGLGVLTNIPGDDKPTGLIEDTAVVPERLPDYIRDFREMLSGHGLSCVYYAHIATGELHLKPVLNLRRQHDHQLFHQLATETALLVKSYRGSLSGEHGDGRLRGQFIPIMLGQQVYQWLCELKNTWDPQHILNPGKITETPPMNESLRYRPTSPKPEVETFFDFRSSLGWLGALEQCNGSADCRKAAGMGGTMCPSYMATGEESHTTRARTNLLREFLNPSDSPVQLKPEEVYEVLSHCLSCKACKSECPSGIDMTKYKAEFLQWYYDQTRPPLRARMIANISRIFAVFSHCPNLFNAIARQPFLAHTIQRMTGFSTKRPLPRLSTTTLRKWYRHHPGNGKGKRVLFFADEFTNYQDTEIGIKALLLLRSLGYNPVLADIRESGRSFLSKGFLRASRDLAEKNLLSLMRSVSADTPLVGIEPGALLCLRDEYPELVREEFRATAREIALHCFTIEELIARDLEAGYIRPSQFTSAHRYIRFHGHCYQKALTTTRPTQIMLSIPANYNVSEMATGCCGMAGSFGYEKEHYDLSMMVGEMQLFPAVRASADEIILVAPGTSCRQHIQHGTGRIALHPAEVLYDALLEKITE